MPADDGYTGTPLAKKLGIREGDVVCVIDDPGNARRLIAPLPPGASFGAEATAAEVVVFFARERSSFEAQIETLARAVFPDRALWVAWPTRTSGVATDMTEDIVREVALPLGIVDNKVCSIDGVWTGLRLVWRKELRADPPR